MAKGNKKDTWTVTQAHIDHARMGLVMQAKAHGLDLNDKNIKAFIEHEVKVIAAYEAQCNFYSFKFTPENE
jgi:hypothetical protein